jgi:hypothetical protein
MRHSTQHVVWAGSKPVAPPMLIACGAALPGLHLVGQGPASKSCHVVGLNAGQSFSSGFTCCWPPSPAAVHRVLPVPSAVHRGPHHDLHHLHSPAHTTRCECQQQGTLQQRLTTKCMAGRKRALQPGGLDLVSKLRRRLTQWRGHLHLLASPVDVGAAAHSNTFPSQSRFCMSAGRPVPAALGCSTGCPRAGDPHPLLQHHCPLQAAQQGHTAAAHL